MNTVKGKNVVIEMYVAPDYYPIFCAKSGELVTEQDEIEVTSTASGSSKEFLPGMFSGMLTCSGVTVINNTDNKISVTYLMQQSVRRVVQTFRITMTDDEGTVLRAGFQGVILGNSLQRETTGYSQSSTRIRVSGDIEFSEIILPPTPENEYALYLTVVAGQNAVSHADLDGATILQVQREGVGHTEVSGTPAAGGREFKYTDGVGTGTITFDAGQPFVTGEIIYVLYRT